MMSPIDNELSYIYPNDRRDNYWFELQENTGTLYFQFNRVLDQAKGESLTEFTDRLEAFVDTHDFDRFVIDLRKNDGGGVPAMHQLLELLAESGKINRRGRLFALTSRKTFSAAVIFLSMLKNSSKVIVVGEPTGQGPVFCAGPQPLVLPNSEREFLISRRLNHADPFPDRRESIEPDIYTDYTRDDFLSGRDPAMEAVLAYREEEIPNRIELNRNVLDRYAGRYIFSPCQIMTVERQGRSLTFTISDFLEGSYQNARSSLHAISETRFAADIAGVELRFIGGGRAIELKWRDRELTLRRAPEGFMLPMELLQNGRVHEGVEALSAQRDIYRERIPDLESMLNRTGYALLRERKCSEAIAVFRLNVELYPESSNTYDSLGEAYMENGDTVPAVKNYRKSLELDPGNDNAVRMLEILIGS
jgi:tetratricopeptide (TPR) repeat protein